MKHLEKRAKKTAVPRHYRATATTPRKPERRNKKRETIVHHVVRIFNLLDKKERVLLVMAVIGCLLMLGSILAGCKGKPTAPEASGAPAVEKQLATQAEYIFKYQNGVPVNVQNMTSAWSAETGINKRYELTDEERWEIASVVTGEARGEPYAGKLAVAQCILQACEDDTIRPSHAIKVYGYTIARPQPTQEALDAVQAVFDFGQVATSEPIKYFYAPAITESVWHESLEYVMTINGHRFFKEAE